MVNERQYASRVSQEEMLRSFKEMVFPLLSLSLVLSNSTN